MDTINISRFVLTRALVRGGSVAGLALVLSACNNIDLTEYAIVPSDDANTSSMSTSADLVAGSCSGSATLGISRTTQKPTAIDEFTASTASIDAFSQRLPESVRQSNVVDAVLKKTKRSSARAIHHHYKLLSASYSAPGGGSDDDSSYIEQNYPEPSVLSTRDFRDFHSQIAEHMLRHTKAKSNRLQATMSSAEANADAAFWTDFKSYYSQYFDGTFVDYFGSKYAQPSISTTISDTDLGSMISVFFEFLFDEAAKTPLWVVGDGRIGTIANTSTVTVAGDVATSSGWKKGLIVFNILEPTDNAATFAPAGTIPTTPSATKIGNLSYSGSTGKTTVTLDPALKELPTNMQIHLVVSSDGKYYPAKTANAPSRLTTLKNNPPALRYINLKTPNAGCGMTVPKAEAINFMAQTFSTAGSTAAGTIVGTVGGLGVSFGLFGKVSVGDNKAVTAAVQAAIAQIVKRLTVEATYRVLMEVPAREGTSSYEMTSYFSSANNGTPSHYSWLPW